MLNKIKTYIAQNCLLAPNATVIVGLSGGMDSMAMLDMLIKKGTNVVVCALNYHSFEGSDADFFALQI